MSQKAEDTAIYILGFTRATLSGFDGIVNKFKERYFNFHDKIRKKNVPNMRNRFSVKEQVWELINKCHSKYVEKISSTNSEYKYGLIDIVKEGNERSFSIVFGNHKEVGILDYIDAKDKLLKAVDCNLTISNEVKNTLSLTKEEIEEKLFFETHIKAYKASWDKYNFINSVSCILNMSIYINSNSNVYEKLLEELNIKKEKSRFNFFPFKNEKSIFDNLSPLSKEVKDNIVSYGSDFYLKDNALKEISAINKTDILDALSKEEKNYDVINSLIGACSELSGNLPITILSKYLFEELEKIAVCFLKHCETNQEIPVLLHQIPTHTETGYGKPKNVFYKAIDFISQKELRYNEGKKIYTFDFKPDNSSPLLTISKKDLIIVIQEIIKTFKLNYFPWTTAAEEEFASNLYLASSLLELKWILGIQIPKQIVSLKNGALAGKKENRIHVKDWEFFNLICSVFSDELNKPYEEIRKFIRPFVDIWNESNEEHHNDFDRYRTPPIENPSVLEINWKKSIEEKYSH